jgi:hypothetical protein
MLAKMLASELKKDDFRVNAVNAEKVILSKRPQEVVGDRTVAFLFLAREDTDVSGVTLDAKEWVRRDPSKFTRLY